MANYFGAMGTALYSKLTGGTALIAALGGTAIYQDQPPAATNPPYVIFSHQGGGPENLIPADDMQNDLWFVRAWSTRREQANRLDGLVSDLLHRGSLTVTGFTCFWLVREENMTLVDNLPNGERRYMAGAFYRVRLS